MLVLSVLCLMLLMWHTIWYDFESLDGSSFPNRKSQVLVSVLLLSYWLLFVCAGLRARWTPYFLWIIFGTETEMYTACDLLYILCTLGIWTLVLIWVFKVDSRLVKLGLLKPVGELKMWAWRALRVFGFSVSAYLGSLFWYLLAQTEIRFPELLILRTLIGFAVWVYCVKLYHIAKVGIPGESCSKIGDICEIVLVRIFIYIGIGIQIWSLVPVWQYCFLEAAKSVPSARIHAVLALIGMTVIVIILCLATREALKITGLTIKFEQPEIE